MVDSILQSKMYATKRRRRTVKSVKAPIKDPPKSNPSKRHRERLNGELDHLASLLPFEQSVISKLDKLSILRLGVSYLRTKSYFQAVLPDRYHIESHHLLGRSHLFTDPGFSEGDSILQALYGFLFVVTCDGEVFYAARTVEQYLGFHQSDIIHQSVMELIHSEDRDEFKRQLTWNSMLPSEKANLTLHEVMMPENYHYLHRSFTVRFRCLLDNTSGFIKISSECQTVLIQMRRRVMRRLIWIQTVCNSNHKFDPSVQKTLEISGWIRVMHGQNNRSDEPQLALFATCCPFGPLSLLDLPSRELTFKSKHKMDFAPLSMDNRGKMMFGYSDRDLATKTGYDLIHPDDLNYFASAHQELIKTGSAGLIAYRWLTKNYQWLWLQSSCKVIYKNSKPDFIIITHRQLTDDEGQDLFHKRGNEFKLPYPLLDLDMCAGFDFPNEDLVSKMKGPRNKKQKPQVRDFIQNSKKRKMDKNTVNGLNCYGTYSGINGYEGGEYKPEFLYHYPSNNIGLDSDLLYNRTHGYGSLAGSVYPTADPYRLDVDKHSYTNGYYLDTHRQYQHTLSYHGNSYSDLVAQGSKYGYDVAKYGLESYSLDLAKKVHYNEEFGRLDNEYKKYSYDYRPEWLAPRLNGGLEPVDLRYGSALEQGTSVANALQNPSNLLCPGQYSAKDSRMAASPDDLQSGTSSALQAMNHSSVIKNMSSPRTVTQNRCSSVENLNSPNTNTFQSVQQQQQRANVIHNGSVWSNCAKSANSLNPSPHSVSDHGGSPKKLNGDISGRDINRNHLMDKNEISHIGSESPMSGATPASVIHSSVTYKNIHERSCDKQPLVGGIPVPVVKSPWMHQFPATHNSYSDYKDAWSVSANDMYSYQRPALTHAPKIAIP